LAKKNVAVKNNRKKPRPPFLNHVYLITRNGIIDNFNRFIVSAFIKPRKS
jgi:hypothetical protein